MIIPIYITYCSGCCGTQILIMLDDDGHVLFFSRQYNIFFSFYNPITYLEAIMHNNVVGFKMNIVIYTEAGMLFCVLFLLFVDVLSGEEPRQN